MDDYEMTEEEKIEDMKEVYAVFDRRGDMKVESEKIADVLRSVGLNPQTADVKKLIADDKLTGQRLDFESFLKIYNRIAKKEPEYKFKDIVECWRSLDKEQSGMVGMPAFRNLMTRMGDRLTEDEVEELLKGTENADNHVPYLQIIKTVMNKNDGDRK